MLPLRAAKPRSWTRRKLVLFAQQLKELEGLLRGRRFRLGEEAVVSHQRAKQHEVCERLLREIERDVDLSQELEHALTRLPRPLERALTKCIRDRQAALKELADAARRVDKAAFGQQADFGPSHQALLKALD